MGRLKNGRKLPGKNTSVLTECDIGDESLFRSSSPNQSNSSDHSAGSLLEPENASSSSSDLSDCPPSKYVDLTLWHKRRIVQLIIMHFHYRCRKKSSPRPSELRRSARISSEKRQSFSFFEFKSPSKREPKAFQVNIHLNNF